MKTKILKTFLISALVAGTFGTAFADEGGKKKPKGPGYYKDSGKCEDAGFYWSYNKNGKGKLKCRRHDYIGPSGS